LVLGQAGQDVVQPRPHPFQLGVKGRQDPDGNKEVPQIVVGLVCGHGLERGVGDLDLALGHGCQDAGAGRAVEPVQGGLWARSGHEGVEHRLQLGMDAPARIA